MSKVEVDQIDPQSGTTLTLGTSGDTVSIPSGVTLANSGTATGFASIAWQSSIVTAATLNADANKGYWIDTSSNACTVTLPGSASVGDQLYFVDYARNFHNNALTINQNSLNYQGNSSPNPVYNTEGQAIAIVYSGATQGWIPTSDDDVTLETPQTYSADFLVIAGGAGGGGGTSGAGGGGGAGGYRASYNSETSGGGGSSETALTFNPGTVYTITVGAGGPAGTGDDTTNSGGSNISGSNSSISGSDITDITSTGGGGGGAYYGLAASGGSGGGAGDPDVGTSGASGTSNQGFAGGDSASGGNDNYQQGGGGGGAGSVGLNASTTAGGNGGGGVASTITGSSVSRGGGGGGGRGSLASGAAGTATAGGGAGSSTGAGSAATANTGGGGGGKKGGGTNTGGAGGSGVVILRVPTANYTGTITGSPTVTTDSTDTIMTFNASGSYTA